MPNNNLPSDKEQLSSHIDLEGLVEEWLANPEEINAEEVMRQIDELALGMKDLEKISQLLAGRADEMDEQARQLQTELSSVILERKEFMNPTPEMVKKEFIERFFGQNGETVPGLQRYVSDNLAYYRNVIDDEELKSLMSSGLLKAIHGNDYERSEAIRMMATSRSIAKEEVFYGLVAELPDFNDLAKEALTIEFDKISRGQDTGYFYSSENSPIATLLAAYIDQQWAIDLIAIQSPDTLTGEGFLVGLHSELASLEESKSGADKIKYDRVYSLYKKYKIRLLKKDPESFLYNFNRYITGINSERAFFEKQPWAYSTIRQAYIDYARDPNNDGWEILNFINKDGMRSVFGDPSQNEALKIVSEKLLSRGDYERVLDRTGEYPDVQWAKRIIARAEAMKATADQ